MKALKLVPDLGETQGLKVNQKAYLQTISFDLEIVIEFLSKDELIFTSDMEIPSGVKLFLKETSALLKKGLQKNIAIEVLESRKDGDKFRNCAQFCQKEWDYQEWVKKHSK